MEQEFRKLTCTHCGREISVPAELKVFSCVYCGEKMELPESEPVPAPEAQQEDLDYVRAHLLDCICDYPKYYRYFNRKKYEESFHTYQDGVAETFRAMNRYVSALPDQRDSLLREFVEQFLRDWDAFHRQNSRSHAAAEKQMFYSKLTLAWYAVPAIRDLKLSVSEPFTDLLAQEFARKYPNNPYQNADYETIVSGFRKHGRCFITTAVCTYEGKADDCAELTAFRAFRDGWLSRTETGKALIEEYYDLAPAIVSAIELCDDRDAVYPALKRQYLDPCYQALLAQEPRRCGEIYVSMVRTLENRYQIRKEEAQ